jgi:hypothetical protein
MDIKDVIEFLPTISVQTQVTFELFVKTFGFDKLLPFVGQVFGEKLAGDKDVMKQQLDAISEVSQTKIN